VNNQTRADLTILVLLAPRQLKRLKRPNTPRGTPMASLAVE
jgi:hypothetical protein